MAQFRKIVLGYYREHGRDLPWRRTTDPYHILVSEIMLQQTQVERVSVKYPAFVSAFCGFSALAAAPLADVLSAWQGLGYNRRAIALRNCARIVTGEYGGVLPRDVETLATFPGIGTATASAICAFAHNMPVVFIETNIRRVFIHYFFRNCRDVRDADILPLVERSLYRKNPRVWYWALMDLGSAIKKEFPNPNRRSSRYVRQPAFKGSDREIRGEVIRVLLEKTRMDLQELIHQTGEDRERVIRILSSLEKEGFLAADGDIVAIRSG